MGYNRQQIIMRKKLFTLLLAIVASVGTMSASQINDLSFSLNESDRTAEVTWHSSSYFGLYFNRDWNITVADIPSHVVWDGVVYQVVGIGANAFNSCDQLTTVNIPSTIKYINEFAFSNCELLDSINIPGSVTRIGGGAFQDCKSLQAVTLNNGLINIESSAFSNCSTLVSIAIPNTVTTIGWHAFSNCTNLIDIDIPNSVTTIGSGAFSGCVDLISIFIPNSIVHLSNDLFQSCVKLKNISIPNSVTSIGNFVFDGCHSLEHITLPNTIKSIGNSAFSSCSKLKSISLPDSITNIGALAFGYCVLLDSIVIPQGMSTIQQGTFAYCRNLSTITIPENIINVGESTFSNCSKLRNVTFLGAKPRTIGANAFIVCNSLDSVIIPDVTSWCAYEFEDADANPLYYAHKLYLNGTLVKDLIIPDSVTSIGKYAFYNCSGLTSVEIPNSVTSIGQYAFGYCGGLTSVTIKSETPPTLGTDAFYETKNCPLIVPCSTVDAYKTAWPDYADRITCSGSGSQGITVRLDPQSCADWSVVRLWAWTSEGNLFDAWPGIVVSQDADGWYSYTFDESVESVNIIWTDGTNQTVNIEGVTASTCYALNSTSGKTITASVVDCGSTASNYYTIRFLNWDGTVLQSSQVKEGELPSYTGTTPVRPADEQYTYSFSGWSPVIATATADADYTAQFTATEKTTDPSIPTVQDLATAGYDVANKVVLCLYFDDAPCYDVVIAGTYMADEAGSWITDPEQLVHMAALESFEGWYAAEIPYSNNVQGKPIQLKSNGAFSWEYQSGDADAWIKRGGEGSQTAAIVAGYNNEANIYYDSPGCYIYELAYWKNHNNPCVIIPTHNYTIHLYAPDACEEMKPAIIGNFNNWTTGVAMSETTDEQGKKMYTITIASDEGLMFKFRDAAYDSWSNELQEYLSDVKVWSTFSNFMIPAATQDTTIVYDFSDNSKYRFKLCEKVEDVVVWLKVPTGAPGYYNGAIEMVIYSADEPTATPLQYNQEDELWSVELQAKGSNYFFVREANSEGNYILNYTHYYYSDGSDEYVWSTWGTTFQYYWEDGTGDFTGSKIIMLDISNPSYYKWDVPAIGTGIEDIQGDDVQCTKILRDGQIFIIRGDKTYTLQGQEVK